MSDSLWLHERQHAWLPCPSLSPGVCSNSCPLSQWCYPTILSSVARFLCLQSFSASGLFQWVSSLHQVAKVLEISFTIDWCDLLAVQGTLKSIIQHHSSNTSILQHSAFFMVQLSHPYMTTGKTIALTRWTLVGKVVSPLFNMLSRLVITFLPRSKWLAEYNFSSKDLD